MRPALDSQKKGGWVVTREWLGAGDLTNWMMGYERMKAARVEGTGAVGPWVVRKGGAVWGPGARLTSRPPWSAHPAMRCSAGAWRRSQPPARRRRQHPCGACGWPQGRLQGRALRQRCCSAGGPRGWRRRRGPGYRCGGPRMRGRGCPGCRRGRGACRGPGPGCHARCCLREQGYGWVQSSRSGGGRAEELWVHVCETGGIRWPLVPQVCVCGTSVRSTLTAWAW